MSRYYLPVKRVSVSATLWLEVKQKQLTTMRWRPPYTMVIYQNKPWNQGMNSFATFTLMKQSLETSAWPELLWPYALNLFSLPLKWLLWRLNECATQLDFSCFLLQLSTTLCACYNNAAKSPVTSSVCDTNPTQQWRTSRQWYTCCSV